MMRPALLVGAIVLGVCVTGCRMTADIAHNLVFETCLFADEIKGKVYYRLLAHSAWKEYRCGYPERAESADFRRGFKLGYADYLENGGDGSSHPLPPLHYWKVRHQTPKGRTATVAWLDGFRTGAAAAKESGYRTLIVVPVGTSGFAANGSPSPILNAPVLGNAPAMPATSAPPPVEELPTPRSLERSAE